MINSLIKLANKFAYNGKAAKADRLHNYILKCADEDKEPTPEDLMLEEQWLEEEGIDPYTLTDEDAVSGLAGHDRNVAEQYLQSGGKGLEELFMELKRIQEDDVNGEMEQQMIMDQISSLMMNKKEKPSAEQGLPFMMNSPMVGEASTLIKEITKLATILDSKGKHKEADFFDSLAIKIAEDPDDFFGDDDDDVYSDSDYDAPSDEDLAEYSEDEDDKFYEMLTFISKVAEGDFMSLQAAQEAAAAVLSGHDSSREVYEAPKAFEPKEVLPDNILDFPGK